MTSAFFSDCASASSHFRQLEKSQMKLPRSSPPSSPPSSHSAANRFRERDDRTVGPAGQEGRLQNLLRWGELQLTLPKSASQAMFCWSDDREREEKKKITWLGFSCIRSGRVGLGGCWGTGQVKISTSSGWSQAAPRSRCWSLLTSNTVKISQWVVIESKLCLSFPSFLDIINETKPTKNNLLCWFCS